MSRDVLSPLEALVRKRNFFYYVTPSKYFITPHSSLLGGEGASATPKYSFKIIRMLKGYVAYARISVTMENDGETSTPTEESVVRIKPPQKPAHDSTLLLVLGSLAIVFGVITLVRAISTYYVTPMPLALMMLGGSTYVLGGSVVIAAVKTKPIAPTKSRILFLMAVVLHAAGLVGTLWTAMSSFSMAAEADQMYQTEETLHQDLLTIALPIVSGLLQITAATFAAALVGLSVRNLLKQ